MKSAAATAALLATGCGTDDFSTPQEASQEITPSKRPPNIVLMIVDEMRIVPDGYAADEGEIPAVKEILGFREISPNNPFTGFFPAFMRLRKNSTVLRRHYTAAAACAPSRTTFLTGQYPSLHGVTQVNGTFKVPSEIYFLDPNGVPTIGDWFRAAGYTTHYMGKWHVSNTSEPPFDLEPYGFSDYSTSGPDPDSSIVNLGAYRDLGFADIFSDFFNRQKDNPDPWFAVCSFTNPHDIGAWPAPFNLPEAAGGVTAPLNPRTNPQPIPPPGTISNTSDNGVTVELNPGGFPQETFNLPQTWNEDLTANGKPQCHLDSAWKMQLALASNLPQQLQIAVLPEPTQNLSPELQAGWALAHGQFYVYMQYLVNLQMARALEAFDAAGLAENTILVFTSDHGANTMAHNQMLQKFFTGYNEATQVPLVISSPLLNPTDTMREYVHPTSSIDLAPTLLGLAGFGAEQLALIKPKIQNQTPVHDFVGLNLAPYLENGQPLPRPGVLYFTEDDATKLADVPDPVNQGNFDFYVQRVNDLIAGGAPLFPGSCVEPNALHMLCTGDWKYARYYDDAGTGQPDQFEMYHLPSDPRETTNLVDFKTGALRPGATVPGLSQAQLQAQLELLRGQLAEREQMLLLTS